MHILLFGGSFNPPHLGHLIVIEQAFELIPNIDELWLLPCHNHTFDKSLAPAPHRLAMCQLFINEAVKASQRLAHAPAKQSMASALEEVPAGPRRAGREPSMSSADAELPNQLIRVCSIEIDKKLSGSTYEALRHLKKDYPQHQFSFLIGSDQLPVFTKWQNYQKLLEEMAFYVYPRAGFPLNPLYPNMTALTSPTQVITNISSTLIRKRIQQHLNLTHLLSASIQDYIHSHHLYSTTV